MCAKQELTYAKEARNFGGTLGAGEEEVLIPLYAQLIMDISAKRIGERRELAPALRVSKLADGMTKNCLQFL